MKVMWEQPLRLAVSLDECPIPIAKQWVKRLRNGLFLFPSSPKGLVSLVSDFRPAGASTLPTA